MEHIGLLKAIRLTSKYSKLSIKQREEIRKERLKSLVNHARMKSPYFKKLYNNVEDNFKLSDLPVTNKIEMIKYFDEWVTDRNIQLADIKEFMKDLDNIGRKYQGKYLVFTTSGSTGNPAVILYDKTAKNVMDAVSILRAFARKQEMKEFIKHGGKSAGVFATGGFYLSNSTVRNKQITMPWKKNQVMVVSALNPIEKIVEELNKFKPAMLGGYPTALELLAEQQKAGKLNVSPKIVMTGGEYLSDEVRTLLKDAFGCYVQTNYSCTEGGIVSCECVHQHFHINDDWVIIEPVDENYKPVQMGKQADKWLLTNLSNYTQPMIRYEITDRVTLHQERCPCGNPSPWIEIEGRTDEILPFTASDGQTIVKIPPLSLYAILKEVHEITRFQLILLSNNKLELRIRCEKKEDRELAFMKAKKAVLNYLIKNGINKVLMELSEIKPEPNSSSGKYRHILRQP